MRFDVFSMSLGEKVIHSPMVLSMATLSLLPTITIELQPSEANKIQEADSVRFMYVEGNIVNFTIIIYCGMLVCLTVWI